MCAEHTHTRSFLVPVVQWIKQLRPKEKLCVRVAAGAPQSHTRYKKRSIFGALFVWLHSDWLYKLTFIIGYNRLVKVNRSIT